MGHDGVWLKECWGIMYLRCLIRSWVFDTPDWNIIPAIKSHYCLHPNYLTSHRKAETTEFWEGNIQPYHTIFNHSRQIPQMIPLNRPHRHPIQPPRTSLLTPQRRIFLFRIRKRLTRQHDRPINSNRKTPMATSQGNSSQNQFTDRMPSTAERRILAGKPDTNAHAAISWNDFEDDVEGWVGDRVIFVMVGFSNGDE